MDLDGSLLRNDKTISEYTVRTLNECDPEKFIIVFATGRSLMKSINYIDIIKPKGGTYNNGANIIVGTKILSKNGINSKMAKNTVLKIEEDFPEAEITVNIENIAFTNYIPTDYSEYNKINFDELPDLEVDKIIIRLISIENLKIIENKMSKNLYLEIVDNQCGCIFHKKATKINGIKILMNYFKIDIENTIAFGDGINDKDIIKKCGLGICMENGLPEVKKIADEMCESNENDGIAKWINKNLLKKGQNCI